MALDLISKNPCDFCKPPKLQRKKLQVLDREQRTHMLQLAREAEPEPLTLEFTADQLCAMLAEAERREAARA